jgi:hypothetical protein
MQILIVYVCNILTDHSYDILSVQVCKIPNAHAYNIFYSY